MICTPTVPGLAPSWLLRIGSPIPALGTKPIQQTKPPRPDAPSFAQDLGCLVADLPRQGHRERCLRVRALLASRANLPRDVLILPREEERLVKRRAA